MSLFEQHILPLFEEHRADWLDRARLIARQLGNLYGEITIDHVRDRVPPPKSVDPRVMGAVFLKSEWELVRYEKSNRATCHGRPVGVFRLKRSA